MARPLSPRSRLARQSSRSSLRHRRCGVIAAATSASRCHTRRCRDPEAVCRRALDAACLRSSPRNDRVYDHRSASDAGRSPRRRDASSRADAISAARRDRAYPVHLLTRRVIANLRDPGRSLSARRDVHDPVYGRRGARLCHVALTSAHTVIERGLYAHRRTARILSSLRPLVPVSPSRRTRGRLRAVTRPRVLPPLAPRSTTRSDRHRPGCCESQLVAIAYGRPRADGHAQPRLTSRIHPVPCGYARLLTFLWQRAIDRDHDTTSCIADSVIVFGHSNTQPKAGDTPPQQACGTIRRLSTPFGSLLLPSRSWVDHEVMMWLGYTRLSSGSEWVRPILGTMIFLYVGRFP